jgi:D-lactate dehydrogenase
LNGLIGFDVFGKTVGIVGTGKIGAALARILTGSGCNLLGHDVFHNPTCLELGLQYVDLRHLLRESDIVSLHCPLTPESWHLINSDTIAEMKQGSMLINTARGA